jgi:hypothetical protein
VSEVGVARVVLVLLGLIFLGGLHGLTLVRLRPQLSAMQVRALGLVALGWLVGALVGQFLAYSWLAGIRNPVRDDFFFYFSLVQTILGLVLLYRAAFELKKLGRRGRLPDDAA